MVVAAMVVYPETSISGIELFYLDPSFRGTSYSIESSLAVTCKHKVRTLFPYIEAKSGSPGHKLASPSAISGQGFQLQQCHDCLLRIGRPCLIDVRFKYET
jgi:hypothetical protein